ncbi:type II secretion system F family protein [Clostridium hydrogeniformans]|uniref:type II secretion system F family protein n=1 Tax=Clostridium hydrogeniformans TaxID=349933 RepID=UPI000482A1A6|nr:hypothetical protein [Clostridium hydrogeniformans]
MTNILILIIYTCIFVTAYLVLSGPNKIQRKLIKELNSIDSINEQKEFKEEIKKVILKLPFAKTQNQLNRTGNRLRLNPVTYVVYKISLLVLSFFIGLKADGILFGTILSIPGFLIIDVLLKSNKRKEREEISLDLEDVYRTLKFKEKRNNKIPDAISSSAEVATRCSRFKNELKIAALQMKISGRNEQALEKLKANFDYPEVRAFVKAIKTYLKTGILEKSIEGHLGQLEKRNEAYHKLEIAKIKSTGERYQYFYFLGAGILLLLIMSATMTDITYKIIH